MTRGFSGPQEVCALRQDQNWGLLAPQPAYTAPGQVLHLSLLSFAVSSFTDASQPLDVKGQTSGKMEKEGWGENKHAVSWRTAKDWEARVRREPRQAGASQPWKCNIQPTQWHPWTPLTCWKDYEDVFICLQSCNSCFGSWFLLKGKCPWNFGSKLCKVDFKK